MRPSTGTRRPNRATTSACVGRTTCECQGTAAHDAGGWLTGDRSKPNADPVGHRETLAADYVPSWSGTPQSAGEDDLRLALAVEVRHPAALRVSLRGVEASGARELVRFTGLDDQKSPSGCPHRLFDVV